jgi:hypothetical protein
LSISLYPKPISIPNIQAVPRDFRDSLNLQASPFTYNGLNRGALLLDWNIENDDTVAALALVDGVPYNVINGGIENHTNEPFNIIVLSTGASWRLRVSGITFSRAQQLGLV